MVYSISYFRDAFSYLMQLNHNENGHKCTTDYCDDSWQRQNVEKPDVRRSRAHDCVGRFSCVLQVVYKSESSFSSHDKKQESQLNKE